MDGLSRIDGRQDRWTDFWVHFSKAVVTLKLSSILPVVFYPLHAAAEASAWRGGGRGYKQDGDSSNRPAAAASGAL